MESLLYGGTINNCYIIVQCYNYLKIEGEFEIWYWNFEAFRFENSSWSVDDALEFGTPDAHGTWKPWKLGTLNVYAIKRT